jgi:hypothetical protein
MNATIMPVQKAALETIEGILASAYYSTRTLELEDGSESHALWVEMSQIDILINLNTNLNMITFSTFFFPEVQLIEKLLPHVNYLNRDYRMTKFYIEESSDGVQAICVDFMMNIKSGLDAFTMIDNLRLFHDIVGLAMGENVDTTMEDGIDE